MNAELHLSRKLKRYEAGYLDLEDIGGIVLQMAGHRYHRDTIKDWGTIGKRGHKLPLAVIDGRTVCRAQDLYVFLRMAGIVRSEVETIIADDSEFRLPLPPSSESAELSRSLDRLAIMRSRRERLLAAGAVDAADAAPPEQAAPAAPPA